MADNKDYAEILCEAMVALKPKILEDVQYDTTVKCTIVEIKYNVSGTKKTGKYLVDNGSATFIASNPSENMDAESADYAVDDVVYVTIPMGDYTSNDKIIIGKYNEDEDENTPVTYTSPFDSYVNITDNLLDEERVELEKDKVLLDVLPLVANGDFIDSYFYDYTDAPLTGYTRCGVKADFKSLLKQFNVTSGTYRLQVYLYYADGAVNALDSNWSIDELSSLMDVLHRLYKAGNTDAGVGQLSSDKISAAIIGNSIDTEYTGYKSQYIQQITDSNQHIQYSCDFSVIRSLITTFIQTIARSSQDYYMNSIKSSNDTAYEVAKAELFNQYLAGNKNSEYSRLLIDFSSNDMVGNPYNFESYYTQEKVAILDSSYCITGIKIVFAQDSNFTNASGQLIAHERTDVDGETISLPANIFVTNIQVSLGYDVQEFEDNQAFLYTANSYKYSLYNIEKKTLTLKWLYQFQNGVTKLLTNDTVDLNCLEYNEEVTGSPEISADISWYRYKLGAPAADDYSGVNWEFVSNYRIRQKRSSPLFSKVPDQFVLLYHKDGETSASESSYIVSNKYTNADIYYSAADTTNPEGIVVPGYHVSTIDLELTQSWSQIYNERYVYHNSHYYNILDTYNTDDTIHNNIGCKHYIGFWELLTMAMRIYAMHPTTFNEKFDDAGITNIFKTYYNTQTPSQFTDFDDITAQMYNFLNGFATDVGGSWTYTEVTASDDIKIRDYIPTNSDTYTKLKTATKFLYSILDQYNYETVNNPFEYSFYPDPTVATEQIKAIITIDRYQTRLPAQTILRTPIVEFTNQTDVVTNQIGAAANGLSIYCEDNSDGNYFIYSNANRLLDNEKANEILTLSAHFDTAAYELTPDAAAASLLTEAAVITWKIPKETTMITPYFDTNDVYTKTEDDEWIIITRVGDAVGHSINAYQKYQIVQTYSAKNNLNTIICTITKDQYTYTASKTLRFGQAGTNGTDATLVLSFDAANNNYLNPNALDFSAFGSDETAAIKAYKVNALLYDSKGNNVDLNNSGLGLEFSWSWKVDPGSTNKINETPVVTISDSATEVNSSSPLTTTVPYCYLLYTRNSNINTVTPFLILQCTVSGFGSYNLTTYLSIPINHITSSTVNINISNEIVYRNNDGTIDSDKDNLALYVNGTKETNTTWSIWNPFTIPEMYLGKINSKNQLEPSALYIEDCTNYGILCKQSNNIIWAMPLVIVQNCYPSTTLNAWDGKSLDIDYDSGSIVAPRIAAGKKDTKNTFTGIMMGDWQDDTGSQVRTTGLYGFHEGAQSFAFKEDGTAFIGKSGGGRIEFNGTDSIIQSSAYRVGAGGMMLDLDDGIFKIQGTEISTETIPTEEVLYYPLTSGQVKDYQVAIEFAKTKNNRYAKCVVYQDSTYYVYDVPTFQKQLQSVDNKKTYTAEENGRGFMALPPIEKTTTNSLIQMNSVGSTSAPYFQIRDISNNILLNIDTETYYLQSDNYNSSDHIGTQFNLKDGVLTSYGFALDAYKSGETNTFIKLHSDGNPFLQISSGGASLLDIKDDGTFLLQSANYADPTGTTDGAGTSFNLMDGTLKGYNFKLSAVKSYDGTDSDGTSTSTQYITIDSGATQYPLWIGASANKAKFKVAWDGSITIESQAISEIGGWFIGTKLGANSIWTNSNGSKSSDPQVMLLSKGQKTEVSVNGTSNTNWALLVGYSSENTAKFGVNYNGNLYAKDAELNGTLESAYVNGTTGTFNTINVTGNVYVTGTVYADNIGYANDSPTLNNVNYLSVGTTASKINSIILGSTDDRSSTTYTLSMTTNILEQEHIVSRTFNVVLKQGDSAASAPKDISGCIQTNYNNELLYFTISQGKTSCSVTQTILAKNYKNITAAKLLLTKYTYYSNDTSGTSIAAANLQGNWHTNGIFYINKSSETTCYNSIQGDTEYTNITALSDQAGYKEQGYVTLARGSFIAGGTSFGLQKKYSECASNLYSFRANAPYHNGTEWVPGGGQLKGTWTVENLTVLKTLKCGKYTWTQIINALKTGGLLKDDENE